MESRYVAFLLPLCYTALGLVTVDVVKHLVAYGPPGLQQIRSDVLRSVLAWALAGFLLGLVVAGGPHGWSGVRGYYSFFLARGPNNLTLLRIVDKTRGVTQPVWVDAGLGSGYWLGAGVEVKEALEYLFTLEGTPYRLLDENANLGDVPPGGLVVLTAEHYRAWRTLHPLELFDPGPPPGEASGVLGLYAVYRLGP